MADLLIGCGTNRDRRIKNGRDEWVDLVTLDIDVELNTDVCWDLEDIPLPFYDNTFDEIHAYEVLEHTGRQGDYQFFFRQFEDFHRILKPGGFFAGTVPRWNGQWAWGDPGHKRVITSGSLTFLSQKEYARQVGKTAMSDYRWCYKANFEIQWVSYDTDPESMWFLLKAIK